jgi:predicted nucleic acid-binding protein
MSDNHAVYLDTSALAKWYLAESDSEEVSAYIVGLDTAAVSTLTKTEMRLFIGQT